MIDLDTTVGEVEIILKISKEEWYDRVSLLDQPGIRTSMTLRTALERFPVMVMIYADLFFGGRWLAGEEVLFQSKPVYMLLYIQRIIKGPWPKAEAHLATDESIFSAYKIYLMEEGLS